MTRKRYKNLWRAFFTDVIILNNDSDSPQSNKKMYRNLDTIRPMDGDSYAEAWAKIQPVAEEVHKQAELVIACKKVTEWTGMMSKEVTK